MFCEEAGQPSEHAYLAADAARPAPCRLAWRRSMARAMRARRGPAGAGNRNPSPPPPLSFASLAMTVAGSTAHAA